MKVIVFIFSVYSFTQISSNSKIFKIKEIKHNSIYAYKLPYRGKNYKFYGTINYHLIGNAYVNNKVHNSIIQSLKISENNCSKVNFRILKCTKRNFGYLKPNISFKDGFSAIFLTPIKKKDREVKLYFRTWIYRFIKNYNSEGISKFNKKQRIDFDNMAKYIINLEKASHLYGLRIKKIIFDRRFIKKLYNSKNGKELKNMNIYFAKYLSKKINKKYDDLFYVEFEQIK